MPVSSSSSSPFLPSPPSPLASHTKRRRTDRACDACRKKKTRCDGPWKATNVCSNCAQSGKSCTYLEASQPRGPPKAYVVGLEDRVEELEALLAQIQPGVDFSDELGAPVVRNSWKESEDASCVKPQASTSAPHPLRSSSSLPSSSGPTSPVWTSLPPLTIPFYESTAPGMRSSPVRTTHLRFDSQRKLKKRKPTLPKSSSAVKTIDTGYRSPYASSADSDRESQDGTSDPDSEDLWETSLAGRNRFTLRMNEIPRADDNKITFHGRSSTAGLVETTRRFKFLHIQEAMKMDVVEQPEAREEETCAASDKACSKLESKVKIEGPDNSRVALTRRPRFWQTPHWEFGADNPSPSPRAILADLMDRFPPQDLCQTLIDLYFTHCNPHFPLFHQPTFLEQWEDRLQGQNFWFASCCLMLFATASRWCTDERVVGMPENRDGADHLPPQASATREGEGISRSVASEAEKMTQGTFYSHEKRWWYAGLPYFASAAEVLRAHANVVHSPSLFEVQTLAMMAMFLRATTAFPSAWVLVSIGIRRAIDAGAHRKRVYRGVPNREDELWKRAFWHLVVFDRIGGAILGRSVGIGEEDFDLELPLEVDDPYWGDEHGWKQPPDIPCTISAFNHYIKLTQVVAFTTRTIYAINKPKLFTGLVKGDWRSEVITQLNTALDTWATATPDYLRWSEDIPDPVLYCLSATLSTSFHMTRLLIYRPFIPPPPLLPQSLRELAHIPSSSSLPYPALAICISSARACTRILGHQLQKRSWEAVHIPNLVNTAYVCAGLLLWAFWDLKGQQKALVELQGAGIVGSDSSSRVELDGDRQEEVEHKILDHVPGALDTEQVLQGLKVKLAELLRDIHILLEALEWVEPRWQYVAPMLAQLKASLPERNLEADRAQPSPKDPVALHQKAFQDLPQRQQEQMFGTLPYAEEGAPNQNLRHRASCPSFERSNVGLSANSYSHKTKSNAAGEPPLFIRENLLNLHTLRDEDHGPVQDARTQLPRVAYNSPLASRHPPETFFSEQVDYLRHPVYSTSTSSSSSHTTATNFDPMHSYYCNERPSHSQVGGSNVRAYPTTTRYTNGSVLPSPVVLTRPSDVREPHDDQILDGYHADTAIPPKYPNKATATASSRSSISMGHYVADEDRKSPFAPSSLIPLQQQHGDNVLENHRYYRERHSVRTHMALPFPSGQSELELQYPWPTTQQRSDSLASSYDSFNAYWKPLATGHFRPPAPHEGILPPSQPSPEMVSMADSGQGFGLCT